MGLKEFDVEANALQVSIGFWRKLVLFLNRDIQSFLPIRKSEVEQLRADSNSSHNGGNLDSLVDQRKIEYLAFRRAILDWRDEFHVQIEKTATELLGTYFREVDLELSKVSVFRELFAKPANMVLQEAFICEVRGPLTSCLKDEERKIIAHARKRILPEEFDLAFKKDWSPSEFDCINDIGFKRKNRELIQTRIRLLVLGDNGIVESYRAQATRLASQLIERQELC